MPREMTDEWKGKSVLVLGLGDTGLSSLRWLARHGARLRAADTRAAPPALGTLREEQPGLRVSLGAFDASLLEGVDAVVASPGIALREPILAAAIERGIEVAGDVEVAARALARHAPGVRVLGVTGTNGKSTVTALAAAMGKSAGLKSVAAGNIGLPVLDALADFERDGLPDLLVIELSSYQLETTSSLELAAAAMLNLSQDHLDRYDSLADYGRAKERIFLHCRTRVVNRDDAASLAMGRGEGTLSFGLGVPQGASQWGLDAKRESLLHGSERIIGVRAMAMPGLHNAANGLAAHALCTAVGIDAAPLARTLAGFKGLAHRVQEVAAANGVRFYDDSKGTNVGASVAALEGFAEPVVLIAGGDGKGQDFAPLAPAVARHARAVVLIGRDAARMAAALQATGIPIHRAATLEEATQAAFHLAREGDAVLLSPACASFDMFRNYAHRGDVFAQAARALAQSRDG
ncbi:MAG TPA: UDP-N-acetylmuramoyl-L-alanine--D-glutamate ligase [Usitatibacter sp.]|nr:UDP-N-acetylmuramoyl-L-alanine--D-glutamate ligase [Usitatibacter sp.]